MSDTDDDGKIVLSESPNNLTEAPIDFEDIELLGPNSLSGLNHEFFNYEIPSNRIPLAPYIRIKKDGSIPCLRTSSLDSFFRQTQLNRNEFNKNLLLIHEDLRKAPRGLSIQEYNKRIASFNFIVVSFYNKTDNKFELSFLPDVTDALVIPVTFKITDDEHKYRNKYQQGFAPRSLETMEILERCGFFYLYTGFGGTKEGFTPTHNLNEDTFMERIAVISIDEFYKTRTQKNIDYRGKKTIFDSGKKTFEGMQFVYNKSSGQLVVDIVNKGTFDFRPPNNWLGHFIYDIAPWVMRGNVREDNYNIYMSPEKEDFIFKTYGSNHDELAKDTVRKQIFDLLWEK